MDASVTGIIDATLKLHQPLLILYVEGVALTYRTVGPHLIWDLSEIYQVYVLFS